jgi:hypothetical protein
VTSLTHITISDTDVQKLLGERYETVKAAAEAWARRSRRPAFR